MERTAQEYKSELELNKALGKERDISDKRYAHMIVQRIVFWTLAGLSTGAIGLFFKFLYDLLSKRYLP